MDHLYTLQNVKDIYHTELTLGYTIKGFDEYLRDHYTPIYDAILNFIGYEAS